MKDGNILEIDPETSPLILQSMNEDVREELVTQITDLQSQLFSLMSKIKTQ